MELCNGSETMKEGRRMDCRGEHEQSRDGERDVLHLPRRACFILGLSIVTVAVLLPFTETWLHPSVHTLFLTQAQWLKLLPRPDSSSSLSISLSPFLSALGQSVWSHTHTQKHLATHTHTHTHTSSTASICLCPTGSVLFTYRKPCLLSLPLLLINVSLPLAAQQHNFSHPMNMSR